MSVKKTSLSLQPNIWEELSAYKNKSKVVNDALTIFFLLEKRKAEKEVELSEDEEGFLLSEWEHYQKTGEVSSEEETFSRTY